MVRNYGSPNSSKVAGFDLDDTLVVTKSGKTHAVNGDDWKWWHSSGVLERMQELSQRGYKLVVFTNQKGVTGGQTDAQAFQDRVDKVQDALGLPILVFAGIGDDLFRKPRTGSWMVMAEDFNNGMQLSKADCFFCGDAAGRAKAGATKKDFSDSDLKFALNLGVRFMTPEECFLGKPDPLRPCPSTFPFDPRELGKGVKASHRARLLAPPTKAEVVLVIGAPGSGKSRLACSCFPEYVRVNQDTLKTKERCVQAAMDAIARGRSAVVDNQNKEIATRRLYIDAARSAGVPVRAVLMDAPKDFCFHLNAYRSLNAASAEHRGPDRVPSMVIHAFYKGLQPPDVKEGLSSIVKLDLSSFCVIGDSEDAELLRSFLM